MAPSYPAEPYVTPRGEAGHGIAFAPELRAVQRIFMAAGASTRYAMFCASSRRDLVASNGHGATQLLLVCFMARRDSADCPAFPWGDHVQCVKTPSGGGGTPVTAL
jgi:hypothetical protein